MSEFFIKLCVLCELVMLIILWCYVVVIGANRSTRGITAAAGVSMCLMSCCKNVFFMIVLLFFMIVMCCFLCVIVMFMCWLLDKKLMSR